MQDLSNNLPCKNLVLGNTCIIMLFLTFVYRLLVVTTYIIGSILLDFLHLVLQLQLLTIIRYF